ncbi:hypothetical protein Ae168Ps1_1237 [Pseudonocardia sp. Ae168_Ps1]|uniref:hypothetical protein n=1 Tax=unclassified Pseudonocardia TaxID=2619320 RepID=UPI00094AA9D6|nr:MULTISPECIES: hypothetical protein [unclassified Pseudonocardia]OLL72856.1 hypothetical protein Ae150APs1_1234 [Pseudonocardia sp. Ae150A_Ps1]OLL78831.1 hypothetical protein Ae168Ps1_1237 [Pseudonocardia sp. Ae168_Ps1]OLL87043.1 hypothetical protein Ae263Ps1_4098c [Pseudonocardia sp. Ae263_Ps1]OLL92926.1 hypothetical protein Ae356Ps1_2823 [Pseudonocardia sp. Ae356_Ps1]
MANELHRRAEVQRRAMMTPQQRAEADYVLEVERARKEGESAANQRAASIIGVGFVVACILINVWWVLFFPVFAASICLGVIAYRTRMGAVNLELSNMVVPWDKSPE